MAEKLKEIENALKKIRIDFPTMLGESYAPGPVIQKIITSEKTQEEFEKVYRMTSTGIEPLIEENTEQLKDSAICYHRVHEEVIAAADSITEAEALLSSLISVIKTDNITHYIEELKEEKKLQEKEIEDSEIKQSLAIDSLSVKDIYTGRLSDIMANIQYVTEKGTRLEIKYQTENSLWRIKKEIEKKIKDALKGRGIITQMDLKVLSRIAGCSNTGVYEGVESAMVQIINKVSESMRKTIDQRDSFTKEEEAHSISRVLRQFTKEIKDIVLKIQSIMHMQAEEETVLGSKYRYNTELYERIRLNKEFPDSTSHISLPIYDQSVTDEDIFEKIVDWIKKLFKRLIGQSGHVSENTEQMGYSIEKINRTESANLLYKELYINKYGEIGEAGESSITPDSVMNVYSVRSEESILIIHGCTLEIAGILRGVLAEVLPERLDIADKVKDLEISRCFKRKRSELLRLVEKATASSSVEHSASFVQRYCIKTTDIIASLERLISVPVIGLEREIEKTAEEVLGKMVSSLEEVFRLCGRMGDGPLENICYYDLSITSQEIEKWNNPLEESVLGPSVFANFTSKKFLAVSEFMQIPKKIGSVARKARRALDREKDSDTGTDTDIDKTPEKEPKETAHSVLKEIEEKTTDLSQKMFGYFTYHLLSLARVSLEQILIKGDFLDRKLHHFLDTNGFLVKSTTLILLEYITTHLFLNIHRCVTYTDYPLFKQAISSLQNQLIGISPVSAEVLVKYSPMNIFYIIPYFQTKDKVFCSGVLGLYKDNSLITQKISEIFEEPAEPEKSPSLSTKN